MALVLAPPMARAMQIRGAQARRLSHRSVAAQVRVLEQAQVPVPVQGREQVRAAVVLVIPNSLHA